VTEVGPDAAAELRLIRSEITAIRQQVIREQVTRERAAREHTIPAAPAPSPAPHLIPPRHYRVMGTLRGRIHRRAHLGTLTHEKISRQRRAALYLTFFAGIRCLAWLACMAFIGLHEIGIGGGFIGGFARLSGLVVWVSVISYYCNASTDLANFTAGLAALFSSDTHAATVAASASFGADFASLEDDIARLADLQPGTEASELSDAIRHRLQVESGRP